MPSGPGNKGRPMLSKYGRLVSGCPQVSLAATGSTSPYRERTQDRRAHAAVSACGLRVRIRPTSAIVWLPSYAPGPLLEFKVPSSAGPQQRQRLLQYSGRPVIDCCASGCIFGGNFNLIRELEGNRVQVSCFLFPPNFRLNWGFQFSRLFVVAVIPAPNLPEDLPWRLDMLWEMKILNHVSFSKIKKKSLTK